MLTSLFCVLYCESVFLGIRCLESRESLIGRDNTCPVWLPGGYVSRKHAMLKMLQDNVAIRDLSSRNGTALNGRRINQEEVLKDGDEIRIGDYTLKICLAIGSAIRHLGDPDSSTQSNPLTPNVDQSAPPQRPPMTPAQTRVFEGFVAGLSEKEVASKLNLSIHTVHTHSKAIYKAFEISSRAELLSRWAALSRNDDPH